MTASQNKVVRLAGGILVALSLSGALLLAACKPTLNPAVLRLIGGGQVHGYVDAVYPRKDNIAAANFNAAAGVLIRKPGAEVYLETSPAHAPVSGSGAITNGRGYFVIPHQPAGAYFVCVKAPGFVTVCDPSAIDVVNQTIVLSHDLLIQPASPGAVYGHVLQQDGRVCYQDDQEYGTRLDTKLELTAGGGGAVGPAILANSRGEYMLPVAPGAGNYTIHAACAGGRGDLSATFNASDLQGAQPFNLTLANSTPIVVSLLATSGGVPVRELANVGDTLKVTATVYDPDGNGLHYKWFTATPGFSSVDASTVSWTLPAAPAMSELGVQVTDANGGYAYSKLVVRSGLGGVAFGGTVFDRLSHAPLAGAKVSVNDGAPATTNASGVFFLSVAEKPRYVLNVEDSGYALLSQVYTGGAPGLQLPMDRVQSLVVDLGKGGEVTYRNEKQEGVTASVSIAPGTSVVDAGGHAVAGPVHVGIMPYDVTRDNAVPGDASGTDATGTKDFRLQSYGAAHVEVTDAGGHPLELAPGASATLTIGVNPAQLATAPHTIPFFTYDKHRGYWKQEGNAVLVGGAYKATVKHFSQFNADTVFTNTACIRMTVFNGLDPVLGAPPFPFILHATIVTPNAGTVNHNDFPVTEAVNGLFRLPPNVQVQLDIHPGSGPDAVLGSITVNSGNPISNSYNGFPPFPYSVCNGFDPASTTLGQPVVLSLSTAPHDVPYLSTAPASQAETDAYFKSVGAEDAGGNPTATRGTFSAWKTTNGFSQNPNTPGPNEIEAIYYNNRDLQLGRDMHCIEAPPKVACYVTNYGSGALVVQGDPQTALTEAITQRGTAAVATVAMEYDPALAPNAVRFYAYKNQGVGGFDGTLFANPALDSEGAKFLPQNCMACHGGSYDVNAPGTGGGTAHNVENASFLAFDVFSFLYDQVNGYTLANQQDSFRQLNKYVQDTNPNPTDPNHPITDLIAGLYPCGVGNLGCAAVDGFVPGGWSGNSGLYTNVPKLYCRTCHLAQTQSLDWTQLSQWTTGIGTSLVTNAVCAGSTRVMPHAEVPYKEFWFSTNPSGPTYLASPSGLNIAAGCPNH